MQGEGETCSEQITGLLYAVLEEGAELHYWAGIVPHHVLCQTLGPSDSSSQEAGVGRTSLAWGGSRTRPQLSWVPGSWRGLLHSKMGETPGSQGMGWGWG